MPLNVFGALFDLCIKTITSLRCLDLIPHESSSYVYAESANLISLILQPALPMMQPICSLGIVSS